MFDKILTEARECMTECKTTIHNAGNFARSDEGIDIRTTADSIHLNAKEERMAFEAYMEGTISGDQYAEMLKR